MAGQNQRAKNIKHDVSKMSHYLFPLPHGTPNHPTTVLNSAGVAGIKEESTAGISLVFDCLITTQWKRQVVAVVVEVEPLSGHVKQS